jgi:hypothetical protein
MNEGGGEGRQGLLATTRQLQTTNAMGAMQQVTDTSLGEYNRQCVSLDAAVNAAKSDVGLKTGCSRLVSSGFHSHGHQ